MAVKFDTKYPPELTNATWQKKKSFLDKAKSSTKTGLGDALDKAEDEWKKTKWTVLDYDKQYRADMEATIDKMISYRKAAQAELAGQVKRVYNSLTAAGYKAKQTAANKALSSDAIKAAQAIATKAYAVAAQVNAIDLDDYDKGIKRTQDQLDDSKVKYKTGLGNLEKALRFLSASPTLVTWKKLEDGKILREKAIEPMTLAALSLSRGLEATERSKFKAAQARLLKVEQQLYVGARTKLKQLDAQPANAAAVKAVIEAFVRDATPELNELKKAM